jgi:drug/metabolite transporter (DMT)-like permease
LRGRISHLSSDFAILASAVLWGTLWIPLRQIHDAGLSREWATAASFLLPLLVLAPLALRRWRRIAASRGELATVGFWLALAIALYAEGVVRGQVARVVLLFYLTPVWSTLLARWQLGEPITGRRVATILLGLGGMLVLFGAEAGIPMPRAAAEWMGLVAGIAWAVSMVHVNRTASHPPLDRVLAQFAFLGPLFLLVTLIPGGEVAARLQVGALAAAAPRVLVLALVWMLPVVWLTIFGASRLEPGRVAILLMLEIVVTLTTAALLTDEPFGRRELGGAALILAASGVELGRATR